MADQLTKQALGAELIELFAKHATLPKTVSLSSHITGDLGIDSLGVMEVVAEIEDHYSVSFPDDDLPSLRTVGDVVNAVHKCLLSQDHKE